MLEGTGWARYEILAEPGTRVQFELDAPDTFDLCEPFFSDERDLTIEDVVAVALYNGDDLQAAPWYMLHGMPWGWPTASGAAPCGKGSLTAADDRPMFLVVATTMQGMAVDVDIAPSDGNATAIAALAAHPAFGVHAPAAVRSAAADLGYAFAATQERWTSETTGGPRFVEAISWQMEQSTGTPMAHAELQQARFGVTGIDEPREPGPPSNMYHPGFGFGSMTGGASTVNGFAACDEPVVAWAERHTLIGVVTGERHAGLAVWALPLAPPT